MALLTKSRYMLSPPPSAAAESAKLRESEVDAEQPLRRPPRMPSSQAMTPRKRRLAAALEALQATKRQQLALAEDSTSTPATKSSSDRDTSSSSSQPSRGIVRRSTISSGSSGGHPGRPRSLQFALKDLSSTDTRCLLQTLADLPHDIARLNAVANSSNSSESTMQTETKVFGWHNSFLSSSSDSGTILDSKFVIWKACKTFESTDMRPLAQKVWNSTETLSQQPLSKIRSWELLYSVSESVRVVKRVDSLYGRHERETIWLECFLDRGDHFCIGRKQLTRFRDYQLIEGSSPSAVTAAIDECECEGFLFRPHLTKLSRKEDRDKEDKPKLLLGCTLQCVSSIAPREMSTEVLLRNLMDDLPRFTLQWEEAIVHDLLPHVKF